MNKIWYLSTCDTCKRIIKELDLKDRNFEFIDIRINIISKEELEKIKTTLDCTYEDLFNKRSRKYTKGDFVSDMEFKEAILKEYTFLKRPIIFYENKYFVGNSKKVTTELERLLK